MSLADALIAATALEHGLSLATHNIQDFTWIENLSLFDPLIDKSI
jgi:predicted nucleic acid-binding protein